MSAKALLIFGIFLLLIGFVSVNGLSAASAHNAPPLQQETASPTDQENEAQKATTTPFPTATYTLRSNIPTRTYTPTQRWPGRKRSPTPYPTPTNSATPTPTITQTPTPYNAYLRIAKPGNWSMVMSGFQIEANISPGDDGQIRLDLIGEDSRAIVSQLLKSGGVGRRFWIAPKIDFQITAAAETARLILSVSDFFDRKIALTSVDLILLFLGKGQINPVETLLEPYVIWYPVHKDTIYGGVVHVGGLARPINNKPLILELIDEKGNIVGSAQYTLAQPLGGEHTHSRFEVDVPYSVSTTTPVRLTLRQESAERIPGTVALSSQLLTLEP